MHSSEPWAIHKRNPTVVVDSTGDVICFAYPLFMDNAERIVACVNAMEDVPDPAALIACVKRIIERYSNLPILVPCDPHEISTTLAKHISVRKYLAVKNGGEA